MIADILRRVPLPLYEPLRRAVATRPRHHPARVAATLLLRHASAAHRNHLAARLGGAQGEIRPLDAPDLSFEPVDSMVMDAVFWFGVRGYEGTVARVWAGLCRHARSVLEIGGNVGLFTVIGARASASDYAVVEPVPANIDVLRANLRRNGLTDVDVLEGAVITGDTPREVILNVPDEGRGQPVGAHLLDGVEITRRSTCRLLSVAGLPIRDLAAGRDLIKIDAEGIEAALLEAARPLLMQTRPNLVVEQLPEAAHLATVIAALAEAAGYRITILPEYGDDRLVEVEPQHFNAGVPSMYRSKDIVLSIDPIQQ
jgi:FkbM family methyltransferase